MKTEPYKFTILSKEEYKNMVESLGAKIVYFCYPVNDKLMLEGIQDSVEKIRYVLQSSVLWLLENLV